MLKLGESSSIHGVQYIFNKNLSKFSRFLWFFVLVCSICGFGFYLRSAYFKWQISPDISITTRERNIKDFPHPAVTICPNIFSDRSKADLLKLISHETSSLNYTKSECLYTAANAHWCLSKHTFAQKLLENKCKKFLEEIDEISPIALINESLAHFSMESWGPQSSLVPVLTHFGICYTNEMQDFNTVFTDEIHDDFKGYFQR